MPHLFVGPDPRDYFTAGRVNPGDVVDWPDGPPPDGCWAPAPPPTSDDDDPRED